MSALSDRCADCAGQTHAESIDRSLDEALDALALEKGALEVLTLEKGAESERLGDAFSHLHDAIEELAHVVFVRLNAEGSR